MCYQRMTCFVIFADSSQISPSEGTARIIANMAPLLEDLKDPMKLIFPELPKEIEVDIKNSSSQDGTRVLLKWVMKQSEVEWII